MTAHAGVLLFITLWASMQDGLGLPVMQEPKEEAGNVVPSSRVRTRRCACLTLLDSECQYFCHLDIIWVNTPSKTTVYGLGGDLSRRRRSTGRCTCAKPDDRPCADFCHRSPEMTSIKGHQLIIRSILRALAIRPKKSLDAASLHRDGSAEVQSESTR